VVIDNSVKPKPGVISQGHFMKKQVTPDAVYAVSGDVVVRKIEDEVIIIPVTDGTDDSQNEPYFLNSTGQAVWRKLNGKRNLKTVVESLAFEFKCSARVIEKDVIELVRKLLKKKLLVEVSVK
jgi:hypothetical protein